MSDELKKVKPKQERFCQEYMVDMNGQQAAIRAGYAKKNARNTAYKFLHHPTYSHVQARLEELKIEMAEKRGLSVTYLIDRLLKIVNDDIDNYFEFEKGGATLKDLTDVDTWNVNELSFDKQGNPKVKLHSKDSALSKIGDILGAFKASEEKVKLMQLELQRERFEFEKQMKAKGEGSNSLEENIKHIKTLADYLENPQPNRSLDDE